MLASIARADIGYDKINRLIRGNGIEIDPVRPPVSTEPRKLSLCIAARSPLNQFDSLIQANLVIKILQDLFIANSLTGR